MKEIIVFVSDDGKEFYSKEKCEEYEKLVNRVNDIMAKPESPQRRCTGIRDKNNVLIYEGDTVETKYGRFCKVVWKTTPCFVGFDLEPLEFENHAPDAFDLWGQENLEIVI